MAQTEAIISLNCAQQNSDGKPEPNVKDFYLNKKIERGGHMNIWCLVWISLTSVKMGLNSQYKN